MALHELSHSFANGMPHHFAVPPFLHVFQRRLGDVVRPGGVTVASDLLVMPIHVGTHIDAPSHVAGEHDVAAAGADARTLPALLTRAVVLDCREAVDAGRNQLGPADLRDALRRADLSIAPGDVVLLATGWERHWPDPDRYAGAGADPPGIDLAGAAWLADLGVTAIGADTPTLESRDTLLGVHRLLLQERGVYIIENLRLTTLLGQPEREVLFVALPLRIVDGTGSPIRCVAVTGAGLRQGLDFFRAHAAPLPETATRPAPTTDSADKADSAPTTDSGDTR